MPRRIAVPFFLLIAVLGTSSRSGADCNPSLVTSGQFRSTANDLTVDGSDLWVATNYGVSLYDRSATPPAVLSSTALPGPTTALRAANGTVWAASGTSLFTLQKEGTHIRKVQRTELGGSVNDMIVIGGYLFVAGSNGLTEVSVVDPKNPSLVANTLLLSGRTAYSLATDGTYLYVADGDSTIEVFNVSTPELAQKIGTVTSTIPHPTSVKVLGRKILVSDGQQTDVFSGTGAQLIRLAGLSSIGTTALASIDSNVAFVGGNGRRISAIDFSVPGSPVILFADEPSPTGGTVNRIFRLVIADDRLYAAGGDLGVLVWDRSKISAPYALRVYPTGPLTSIGAVDSTVVGSLEAGGLQEFSRSTAGTLTSVRTWDPGRSDLVQDLVPGLVLSSSGSALTLWSLSGAVPTALGSVAAAANIKQAVILGSFAFAVLENGSLIKVDFSATPPVLTSAAIDGAVPSFIARNRSDKTVFWIADLNADASTTVRYVSIAPDSSLSMRSKRTLRGLASSGITVSGSELAAFTFEGIVLVNFGDLPGTLGPPSVFVVPQTRTVIPDSLLLDGTRVFVLSGSEIQVRDKNSGSLIAQMTLPSSGIAMSLPESGSNSLLVATNDGPAIVSIAAIPGQPVAIPIPNGNSYYKKIVAGPDHLYLFDGSRIDSYALSPAGAPSGFDTVPGISGAIDLAATPTGLAVVSNSGRVASLAPGGAVRSVGQINEGAGALARSIFSVGGDLWVSISHGCLTDSCDEETLVFDDNGPSMAQTGTMSGSVFDVTVSGTRAYALVAPSGLIGQLEIRVIDIADPHHPVIITSRLTDGTFPVSIAHGNGVVYVLGEKLYVYSEDSLTSSSEILGSYQTDPLGPRYTDQRLLIGGNCALVSGRGPFPQLYTIASPTAWIAGARLETPALTRSAVAANGAYYLLTDDSIEVWSSLPQPRGKHRASQRSR